MSKALSLMSGWRRSTRRESGYCVEVAFDGERVLIRDSKDPYGGVIAHHPTYWNYILVDCILRDILPPGVRRRWFGRGYIWSKGRVKLRFTTAEWDAFVAAVKAAEFDLPGLAA